MVKLGGWRRGCMVFAALAVVVSLSGCTSSSSAAPSGAAAAPSSAAAAPSSAAAAPSSAAAAGLPKIYVIAPSLTDPFWIAEHNGADLAGKQLGADVIFEATPTDTGDAGMASLARAAVATKPDGIAIDYTSKVLESVTTAALDAGIPTILYNNNRFEGANAPSDPRILDLAYVGDDYYAASTLLAKSFVPLLKTPGCKVLLVNPFPTAFVLYIRMSTVKGVLQKAGFQTEDFNVTGDEQQNYTLISAKLQQEPSLCGIVAGGDPASNPASKYEQDTHGSLPIATFDVATEAANYIANGYTAMTINQQPFLQGWYAVSDLIFMIKYGTQAVTVYTGQQLVTKDNVAQVQACIAAGRC